MSSVFSSTHSCEILISESLGPWAKHILELSKAYNTVILLYEDDLTGNIMGAWAETDRLKLKLHKIGEVMNGLGVYTFGMEDLPSDSTIEIHLREASQDLNRQDLQRSAYKSLLNELILIQVRVLPSTLNHGHLK